MEKRALCQLCSLQRPYRLVVCSVCGRHVGPGCSQQYLAQESPVALCRRCAPRTQPSPPSTHRRSRSRSPLPRANVNAHLALEARHGCRQEISESSGSAGLPTAAKSLPHFRQTLRELRSRAWAPNGQPAPPLDMSVLDESPSGDTQLDTSVFDVPVPSSPPLEPPSPIEAPWIQASRAVPRQMCSFRCQLQLVPGCAEVRCDCVGPCGHQPMLGEGCIHACGACLTQAGLRDVAHSWLDDT